MLDFVIQNSDSDSSPDLVLYQSKYISELKFPHPYSMGYETLRKSYKG